MITVIRALFGLGPVVYVCCPSGFRSAFFNRSRPFYLLFGTTVHEPQSDSPPVWQRAACQQAHKGTAPSTYFTFPAAPLTGVQRE